MIESCDVASTTVLSTGDLPRDPETHFRLCLYSAVLRVVARAVAAHGSFEAAFAAYPFLAGYSNQLADHGLGGMSIEHAPARWHQAVRSWEEEYSAHLPMRALRESLGLRDEEVSLLMGIGLPEVDARFGALFEQLNGTAGLRRPTVGLLSAWWADSMDVGVLVRRLLEDGLVATVNPEAPRAEWQLTVPPLIWDAMQNRVVVSGGPWICHHPVTELSSPASLILDEGTRRRLAAIAALLDRGGEAEAVIIRGARANGRRTAMGALACATGRGVLEVRAMAQPSDPRWRTVGPLATLLHAMPVIVANPAPGETVELPDLLAYRGPVGVTLGRLGGVSGTPVRQAVSLELGLPGIEERRAHWEAALAGRTCGELDVIASRFRLTRGNLRRAAAVAVRLAALDGRASVLRTDVEAACRSLNREALETLATRISGDGDWTQLAAPPQTMTSLRELETRCRHREVLGRCAGVLAAPNPGVRTLFKGPSGTGKTLAARLLATALGMDLYRLDLSAVVNKYIGETEKNLELAFSRAEELDVILLIDEGDALLTRRTDVSTANDRYANLETNFLLQRLESYTGILIVTTNAGDRIDGAFARRMDVVVEFPLPQTQERWSIWNLHLPAGNGIDQGLLWEIADRCALSGGQIRSAALHAALSAVDRGDDVKDQDIVSAARREYRRSGAVCPLPGNP